MIRDLPFKINRHVKCFPDKILGTCFQADRDIVLITGGTNGLGRELVKEFSSRNTTTVVLDLVLPNTSEAIKGVHYYQCDVSDNTQVSSCYDTIKSEIGQVSVLINNAGITEGKALIDLSANEIVKIVKVNLLSSFYTIQTFLPDMINARRGYIVTISSTLGYMSPANLSAYGATKSGLIAMHESLTYEIGSSSFCNTSGIKTFLVCPGQLQTKMFNGIKTPSKILAPELKPSDVARRIVSALEHGRRGELKLPFYGNFLPIFRAVPWPLVTLFRFSSGIDRSTLRFEGHNGHTDRC